MRRRTVPRRMWIALGGLLVISALGPGAGARGAVLPADMVLVNGKIVTLNARSLIAQALAIQQGKVVAVGTDSDIRPYAGNATRVIDPHGRTVIPGLVDSHAHAIRQGLTWNHELHWQTRRGRLREPGAVTRLASPGGMVRGVGSRLTARRTSRS